MLQLRLWLVVGGVEDAVVQPHALEAEVEVRCMLLLLLEVVMVEQLLLLTWVQMLGLRLVEVLAAAAVWEHHTLNACEERQQ